MSAAHDALRVKLDAELRALPRPVTLEVVLSTARRILPGLEFSQFSKWAEQNGAHLLTMLNGTR